MEDVIVEGRRVALIVRADYHPEGIEFLTPHDTLLQLGYMSRPPGYKVQPHVHLPCERVTEGTQEVLIVRRGCVRVDFYDAWEVVAESRELGPGDVILLLGGAHGLEMIDRTEMIEVKNGPYAGVEDKTRLESPLTTS